MGDKLGWSPYLALAALGAAGTFAYRAVSAGAVLPAPPPIVEAKDAPNENVPNDGGNRPSNLNQTSIESAGSSEEFASRFPADNQEPPKTAPISPDASASPPSALAPLATTPAAPPPFVAPRALAQLSLLAAPGNDFGGVKA
jgi:hypothetical protein